MTRTLPVQALRAGDLIMHLDTEERVMSIEPAGKNVRQGFDPVLRINVLRNLGNGRIVPSFFYAGKHAVLRNVFRVWIA